MTSLLTPLTYLLVVVVLGVLIAGLLNMLRHDSANTSQRLMRWRVGLQFVAILVLMTALYLKKS